MPWTATLVAKLKRDPNFRPLVLDIYEHRCAVCGYDGRIGQSDLALEAAHVKWHAAGGPDLPENGLALCVFHHRALDRGALGLTEDGRILVSERVHGGDAVEHWLHRYAGAALREPAPGRSGPATGYVRWHRREVFQEPARGKVAV